MRRRWAVAGSISAAAAVIAAAVALSGGEQPSGPARAASVSTATVEKGPLSTAVSQLGILTYRARPDGAPYAVINQRVGTVTELPQVGDEVRCGGVLYRVDDRPVLLLCGTVPAYRPLRRGDAGTDVRQLNENLHALGYDVGTGLGAGDTSFTANTEQALKTLQHARGLDVTGQLALGDSVFLPDALRIARLTGQEGAPAQRGAPMLYATSSRLQAQVNLAASQQGQVHVGDRAQITLPGNRPVQGKVVAVGRIAQVVSGQGSNDGQNAMPSDATFPAYIALDNPAKASGFDAAPVQVDISTKGVDSALSVPVTAIVGKSGGGVAVEVVRDDGERVLVAVRVGLFDDTAGRVQVEGGVREGDHVVVPPS
jgi:peptidoglycan hydrolase-like protein with peptidoglycan-binding domain